MLPTNLLRKQTSNVAKSLKISKLPPLVVGPKKYLLDAVIDTSKMMLQEGNKDDWHKFADDLRASKGNEDKPWKRFLEILETKNALKLGPYHFQLLMRKGTPRARIENIIGIMDTLNVKKDLELYSRIIDCHLFNGYFKG
jgi:hypothetical protein